MVTEVLTDPTFVRGIVFAILGVAFWASGFVVANRFYKRYRGERRKE